MWRIIRNKYFAGLLSLLVHAALGAVLVFSLKDSPLPQPTAGEEAEIVQAVAVDEAQVQAELDKLREQERRQRAQEAERQRKLEEQALQARQAREAEQRRLQELQRKQAEEQKKLKADEQQRLALQKAEQVRQARLKQEQAAEQVRLEKLKQAQRAEQERLAKIQQQEQERIAALKREQEALERKRQEEQKRLAELEQKRKIEEQKRREAQAMAERQAQLDRQIAEEEARLNAERQRQLASLKDQYTAAIAGKVQRNWIRPSNVNKDATCKVLVSQIPGGEVVSARVTACTGDELFRRSVETAVYKASPLPPAPDPAVFDRDIRFTFTVGN